jgi:hypothetical protein
LQQLARNEQKNPRRHIAQIRERRASRIIGQSSDGTRSGGGGGGGVRESTKKKESRETKQRWRNFEEHRACWDESSDD